MDPYNSADALAPAANTRATAPANPYAAPVARIESVQAGDGSLKATRGARLGAVVLDSVPLMALVVLAMLSLTFIGGGTATNPAGRNSGFVVVSVCAGLGALAYAIYQLVLLHRSGQTFGKKMLGIRIVRSDGSRASLGRIIALRALLPGAIGMVPLVGPFFSLADSLFIFGEERRCLHDRFADTIVVNA